MLWNTRLFGCILSLFFFLPAAALAAGGTLIGKTLTRIPGGDNFLTRALVQPDGKIVVVGAARFGTMQYQITRYNADGSLDAAFATNGTILEPLGPGNGQAFAVALQPDGRIVVAGNVRSDRDKFGIARFNGDGTLDLSFGGGGSATAIGPGDAGAFAMALQADGKIVLGGYSMTAASGGRKVFTLARYNANDTIDTTFGANGFAIAPAGAADEVVQALGLQADGKIVAAGPIASGGTRILRFNTNGTIDGTWSTTTVAYFDAAADLLVQGDGKVAIAGTVRDGATKDMAVLRMNADGSVDAAFGDSNCANHSFACPGVAHVVLPGAPPDCACTVPPGAVSGLALQSGKYVVSGMGNSLTSGKSVALARFTSTGAVDTSFGTLGIGIVDLRPTGQGDVGRGLAIRADGRIIVAGQANGSFGDYDALTVALTANGTLDTTFNGTGFARLDAGSLSGEWKAAALQPDGKLVAAGLTIAEDHATPPGGARGGVVARYLANGTLDTGFGTNGVTQFAGPANAVALQADGRIVAGGSSRVGSPAKTAMTFWRFNTNGTLDTSFGTGGTAAITPSSSDEEINAVAIQSDGKLVGAGFVTGAFLDSTIVRLTSAGAPDTTFNGNGVVNASMSTGSDELTSVAVQPDGKIVAGGWAEISGTQDSMSATRVNADGTLDTGFGTAGVATVSFGSATSKSYAMALQPDGRIVLAGQAFNAANSTDDFAVARLLATGAADSSFGTGGRMSTDFGNHNRIFALARTSAGKLIGAGETGGFFALVQYVSGGTLDIGFATNGSAAEQINAGNDYASAIAVGADGTLYVAGNGSGMLALARFTSDGTAANADVSITQSAPSSATVGDNVTFTLTVSNAGPGSATGVSVTDSLPAGVAFVSASAGCSNGSGTVTCNVGTLASGASTQLTIVVQASSAGTVANTATVSATQVDPNGANNSSSASVAVAAASGTVVNLSTRLQVGTGNNVMIAGFVIGGSTPKTVVVTGIGPSLAGAGIANFLPDPTLTLVRSSDGQVIGTNDDWGAAANASQISAAGFAPANAKESAILMTLPPGAYTAIVNDAAGRTGVGIVAVYEVDHPEVPLINISTRGQVLTGNDVMIAGFVIQGSAPRTVIVTGIGPSLASAGISNPLANPTLTLVRADGTPIATNDDWGSAPNAADIAARGFAPAGNRESAIMMTLPPGAYTAILSGVGGTTGVGIVAVYAQ